MAESEEELKSLLMKVKECEKAGLKLNIHLGEGNGNPLQYLAWKSPWTEEPGGLQSMGLHD